MLTIVAIVAALVAIVLIVAATKPGTFKVQRAINIRAPAAAIYPLLEDLRRWSEWSPWEKIDPTLKRNFSGTPHGVGAIYEWQGSRKVGKGRMEIIAASPPSRLTIRLDFLAPFEAHNIAEFTLDPEGEATRVRWSMQGPAPFFSKLMQVFISMDRMVGKDFETGLAELKLVAEKGAA